MFTNLGKCIIAGITAALLLIAGAFYLGRLAGIHHAIHDAEIWTVDVYNPLDPGASEWNGYDQRIMIELDGNVYEHGMIQC